MNKTLKITYYISILILFIAIVLFITLIIRNIIGFEYIPNVNMPAEIEEIPWLDLPILFVAVGLFGITLFYFPILYILLIIFKITSYTKKIELSNQYSISKNFWLTFLIIIIGFFSLGLGLYFEKII